jgi:hypothetical protein
MNSFSIDKEWESYITKNDNLFDAEDECDHINELVSSRLEFDETTMDNPVPSNIYISTKTKLAYLNSTIDLNAIFWKIKVIKYCTPIEGVIKKQIKCNSVSQEEFDTIQELLLNESGNYIDEYIITSINNPEGRIKFKDIRKISVGISQKDIMSYRCKKKSAFYNCFVLIIRLKIGNNFKEFHVKIFNTGKLEIPGIQDETLFQTLLMYVLNLLQPHITTKLEYDSKSEETVLINSNFNCGFYINREELYQILKYKYNIHSIYDPCSYPGIQSKFYFNLDTETQTGCQISEENKDKYKNIREVSFMIFRTGSVLIVGRCDEIMLTQIYEHIKVILSTEYPNIHQKNINNESVSNEKNKDKKRKIRKKIINVNI